jgi:GR25 family glycosyltransferase involved in LPS biosynthesis
MLCADNRSPYVEGDTYYKYCIGMSQVYAKKYNIDFIFDELKSVPDGRHWSWARILLLAKYYPKYDEIIWMDSDATIINHDVDVFSLLKTAPKAGWERDASVHPLLYTCKDSPNTTMCCAGIFLLDCTNKSKVKDLLNDWWNDIPADTFKTTFPYEQSVLNDVWRLHPVKRNYVKTVDLDSFFNKSDTQVFIHLTSNYYLPTLQLHESMKYAAQLQKPRAKKIGIFVSQKSFYSSGSSQNCVFIKQSLELLGYKVDLLVENYSAAKGNTITPAIAIFYKEFKKEHVHEYETMIFGTIIPSNAVIQLIKSASIKIIAFHPMNSMDALHIETFVYPKKADTVPLFEATFKDYANEIWLTSNHEHTAKIYMEMLSNYEKPITVVPLTWSPLFIMMSKTQMMYTQSQSNMIEFVIIDPYMSYCKSSWFSLMICEYVHKQSKNVSKVHLFSAPEDKTMIETLQLAKEKRIEFHPRIQITEIINRFSTSKTNVVFVSHQINIPLNYAYFDILSSGFPLLHNSPKLNVGYFYTSLETAAAHVDAIVKGVSKPIIDVNQYLDTIHPGNSANLKQMENLVLNKSEPKFKIHVAVLTINKEREASIRSQIERLKFFQGYSPQNSAAFIATKEANALEDDSTFCITRSYAALFNSYASKSYDYLITLEDDILLANDFIKQIDDAIKVLQKETSIEYITLGMLLGFTPDDLLSCKKDGAVYFNSLPSIWGAQAMLFRSDTVKRIANLIYFQSITDIRNALTKYGAQNKLHRNRQLFVQIDAILPTVFFQGVMYPPIAIESDVFSSARDSTLHNKSNNHLLRYHPKISMASFA